MSDMNDRSLRRNTRHPLMTAALLCPWLAIWLLAPSSADAFDVRQAGIGVAHAGHQPPLRLAQREPPRVSLDEAVAKVRARFEGRVIRADTRYTADGTPVHHIKLLSPDGRVSTIRVDGLTGQIR
jgi:hypothetical protein